MADYPVPGPVPGYNTRYDANGQVLTPYVRIDSSGGSTTISPTAVTLTQAAGTLTAATSALVIAANASRKYLSIPNNGTGAMTVSTANPAVLNQGWVILPGGVLTFDGVTVPINALYGISTPGTTYSTLEG